MDKDRSLCPEGPYAVSWSGGKDSALSLARAQEAGYMVTHALTMFGTDGYSRSHRIPESVVQEQVRLLGLELVLGRAGWEDYEGEFRRLLLDLRSRGVRGCIFGDIDLEDHRKWCLQMTSSLGMEAVHPLYGEAQGDLVQEFFLRHLEAIIVSVKEEIISRDHLGKVLSLDLLEEWSRGGLTPAGELGEYHTLVTSGPIFRHGSLKEGLRVLDPPVLHHEGYGFLNFTLAEES